MYQVRFHLAAGENFMKWQVRNGDEVKYYDPETTTLSMYFCDLINHRRAAEKIFSGANKDVCAWLNCDRVDVYTPPLEMDYFRRIHTPISYNPRKAPYWVNSLNDNIDGDRYFNIITDGRKLFAGR